MNEAVAARLRAFASLRNPARVRVFVLIHDHPGISFNELARRLHVATGQMAYHVGMLRAGGLVDLRYVRRSKETSEYRLSPFGLQMYTEVFETPLPRAGTASERAGTVPGRRTRKAST